jgi:hypothetical protein
VNLKHLTDTTLHQETQKLALREREITVQLLHHLKEIEKRKLFSEYKCSSLYDYCLKILGYSESSAYRRVQSSRALADIPEIAEKIEQGLLTTTNLTQAISFFKNENVTKKEDKLQILEKLEHQSKKEAEKILYSIAGISKTLREQQRRISSDYLRVSINLSDEVMKKLLELRKFFGDQLTLEELIHIAADEAIKNLEKKKYKLSNTPHQSSPVKTTSRVPAASIKREVYNRDKKCQKCGSEHLLQFDHIKPWSLGGETTSQNLRLLCFNCNQREKINAGLNMKGPSKWASG